MAEASLSIRLAAPEEHQLLQTLMAKALQEPDRIMLLVLPDELSLPIGQITAGQVFIAEHSGAFLGLATVIFRQDGEIELDGFLIEPTAWKQGFAQALLAECSRYARDANASGISVNANPRAKDFYLACGFENLGTKQTMLGPALKMRMAL